MTDVRAEVMRQLAYLYQMAEQGQITGIGFAIVRPDGAAHQGWLYAGPSKLPTLAAAQLLVHHLTAEVAKPTVEVATAAEPPPAQLN